MRVHSVARILALADRIGSWWRVTLARASGAELSDGCAIAPGVNLRLGPEGAHLGRIVLGENCQLGRGAVLHPYGGSIVLSHRVFIGPYAVLYGHGGIEIGANTLVSMHCRILSSNHTVPPAGTDIRSQPDLLLPTKIGRDAWLGAGVTILGGVTIGDGCVVGAGAVVTRDLPPQTIAVGVPATVIRSRT